MPLHASDSSALVNDRWSQPAVGDKCARSHTHIHTHRCTYSKMMMIKSWRRGKKKARGAMRRTAPSSLSMRQQDTTLITTCTHTHTHTLLPTPTYIYYIYICICIRILPTWLHRRHCRRDSICCSNAVCW